MKNAFSSAMYCVDAKKCTLSDLDLKLSSQLGVMRVNVQKRYSDFSRLHRELLRKGIRRLPKLPGKNISIFQDSQKFIENRRLALEKYVNLLIVLPEATDFVYHF